MFVRKAPNQSQRSAQAAQSRLWALRGEGIVDEHLTQISSEKDDVGPLNNDLVIKNSRTQSIDWARLAPNHYCLLPSVRRLVLQLNSIQTAVQTLPIIIGPEGSGKTALASYVRRANHEDKTVILTGAAGTTVTNLIKYIVSAVGIEMPEPEVNLEGRLRTLIESMKHQEVSLNILVDRADSIPLPTLAALIHLMSIQKSDVILSVTLLGSVNLVERVESMISQSMECVRVRAMPIMPLNAHEVRAYIHACLKAAGVERLGIYIPETVVQRVTELSKGIPLNIQGLIQSEVLPYLPAPSQPWVIREIQSILVNVRSWSILMLLLSLIALKAMPFNDIFSKVYTTAQHWEAAYIDFSFDWVHSGAEHLVRLV
ncbi:MAG: hypothetical protein CMF51_00555 [Legionellales bacterium]|nr:hypothetical protein [Legionellales bacterium]